MNRQAYGGQLKKLEIYSGWPQTCPMRRALTHEVCEIFRRRAIRQSSGLCEVECRGSSPAAPSASSPNAANDLLARSRSIAGHQLAMTRWGPCRRRGPRSARLTWLAAIVERTVLKQPLDSRCDGAVGVALLGETCAYLRLGQLACGQPAERAEIRRFGRIGIVWRAGFLQRPDFTRRIA